MTSKEEAKNEDDRVIIPEDEIEKLALIGEGGLASVYRATWKGADVAIKMVNERIRSRPIGHHERQIPNALESIWKERSMMGRLLHPNVVEVFGITSDGTKNMGLVMELMQTSLYERVRSQPALQYSSLARILEDVARALAFMHSRDILHRDLSPRNVLLKEQAIFPGDGSQRSRFRWIAKVSDYAAAKDLQERIPVPHSSLAESAHQGTMPYMPKEVYDPSPDVQRVEYTPAVDVYSFGAVCLEAFLKQAPGLSPEHKLKYLDKLGEDHPFHGLLRHCLSEKPSNRPRSVQVLSSVQKLAVSALALNAIENEPERKQPCYDTSAYPADGNSISQLQDAVKQLRKEKEDLRKVDKTTGDRSYKAGDDGDVIPFKEFLRRAEGKEWKPLLLPACIRVAPSLNPEAVSQHTQSRFVTVTKSNSPTVAGVTIRKYKCYAVVNRNKLYIFICSVANQCTLWSSADCITWKAAPLPDKLRNCRSIFSHKRDLYLHELEEEVSDIWQANQNAESEVVSWSQLLNFPADECLSIAFPLFNHIIYSTDTHSLSLKWYNAAKQSPVVSPPFSLPDLSPKVALANRHRYAVVMPDAIHIGFQPLGKQWGDQDRWGKQVISTSIKANETWTTNVVPPTPSEGLLFRALGQLLHANAVEPLSASQALHVLDTTNKYWRELPSFGRHFEYSRQMFDFQPNVGQQLIGNSGDVVVLPTRRQSPLSTNFKCTAMSPTLVCFQGKLISFTVQLADYETTIQLVESTSSSSDDLTKNVMMYELTAEILDLTSE